MIGQEFDIGDVARAKATFQDIDRALVDPSTVTLEVTTPSGVKTAYTYAATEITKDSLGAYHRDIDVTESGTWVMRWSSTGTGKAAIEEEFKVRKKRTA